mgnify:FL=1
MTKEELVQVATNLESRLSLMQFEMDQLKRLIFGSKRERFISNETHGQMALPFDIPEPEHKQEEEPEQISYSRRKKNRDNHPGRMTLPDHLPVKETVIEPDQDTTGMKCIGKEITNQLEYEAAKFFIDRTIRPKYVKNDTETETSTVVVAELPVFPIEKGLAGSGLLTQVLIDKYVDHLPIYRQIERFKREGIKIASSTINGWQESLANLLEPLYDTMLKRVLSQGYLQVDETPTPVLDKNKKGKTHRGYYWVYHSPLDKTVVFDYREGRGREGPQKLLADFKGYLQTDGYQVYDSFGENKSITLLNCMAHARRKFEKALDYNRPKAEYAMEMFQKIYDVERKAREQDLDPEQRYKLRLDESLPLLNELGKWIIEIYKTELPKSPLAKACAYCIPRWDKLLAFLNDGSLEIDSNLVENAIRPVTLGRKNYLFAGSTRGAQRAAMFYSFFGTCKKNKVNPFQWLKKVLQIIPEYKVNKLHELLPQNLEL